MRYLLYLVIFVFSGVVSAEGEPRKASVTVALSHNRNYSVVYEIAYEGSEEPVQPKHRFRGEGSVGDAESEGVVRIVETSYGKQLAVLGDDFRGGTISAFWHPSDTWVIIRWATERFNWGTTLYKKLIMEGKEVFQEVNFEKAALKEVLKRDPRLNHEAKYFVSAQGWERTNLIVSFIAIEQDGGRPHPFAQDELWYDARIAFREDGSLEPVALWRTHGTESGQELVWEK